MASFVVRPHDLRARPPQAARRGAGRPPHTHAYTVNLLGDTSGSSSGRGTGLTGDLRYCINQAITDGQADTITFDTGVFSSTQTITLDTTLITDPGSANAFGRTAFVVSGSARITLTGSGAGVTLDAGNAERLFALTGGATLTLQGLTLQHGLAYGWGASAQGGAIYSQGNLTLTSVSVLNNTAQGPNGGMGDGGGNAVGGGVFVAGGTAALTNSTFAGNLAQGGAGGAGRDLVILEPYPAPPSSEWPHGGGGGSVAGGVYLAGGTATLTNNTLSGNRAQGGAGGAGGTLYRIRSDGFLTTQGLAGGADGGASGGGLFIQSGSTIFLNNTLIARNTGASAPTSQAA